MEPRYYDDGGEDIESIREALDVIESDNGGSDLQDRYPMPWSERRTSRTRTRVPSSTPSYTPPPPGGPATKADLAQLSSNVDRQIATLSSRVDAVTADQGRQVVALRRETAARRNADNRLNQELARTREMSFLMPMLSKTPPLGATTAADTVGGTAVPVGTKLAREADGFGAMLPFLIMGMGSQQSASGSSGGTGSSGGGMDMLLMALVFSQFGKS
jgi:hypothetical protein